MGISRELREEILDRELHKDIKAENAEHLNAKLYLLDQGRRLTNKSNKHEHNREALRGTKAD